MKPLVRFIHSISSQPSLLQHPHGIHTSLSSLTSQRWDATIIGGGHNGLITAFYLARKGLSVLLLERRHIIGGAAVTEEIIPGYHFSRASYLQGLLRPSIVKDLKLHDYGYTLLPRDVGSFTPCRDGRYLMLGTDVGFNQEQIKKFSEKDAERYEEYEKLIKDVLRIVEPLFDSPPMSFGNNSHYSLFNVGEKVESLLTAVKLAGRMLKADVNIGQVQEVLLSSASSTLNRFFESEVLKATLATDGIIGAMNSPASSESGYCLLHHMMGEPSGSWNYIQGGMGALTSSIKMAAVDAGAEIVVNAPVRKIMMDKRASCMSEAVGIELEDGEKIMSKCVISNADALTTFVKLGEEETLPDDFRAKVRNIDYESPVFKINVALKEMPKLVSVSKSSVDSGKEYLGTIHMGAESLSEIEAAYTDAKVHRQPSERPVIEMTIPSSLDDTLAPKGHAVVGIFAQYAPYDLPWENESFKHAFVKRVFSIIDEYAPNFSQSIAGYDALSPKDLESIFGLHRGNIFHGAMSLGQIYASRPVPGFCNYRTPVKNLYLCGASTHPGGGVMGAAGKNCANTVLRDFLIRGQGESVTRMMGAMSGEHSRSKR